MGTTASKKFKSYTEGLTAALGYLSAFCFCRDRLITTAGEDGMPVAKLLSGGDR